MIFDIYVQYDDADYKDVYLDMALEDYHGPVYRAQLTLDKAINHVEMSPDIFYSPSGEIEFTEMHPNDKPEWVKRLVLHLAPRMHEVMKNGKAIRRWLEDSEAA